jgi:type I restriction enzyme S subunit
MEVKPGYKQTEVGVIPEEWEVERLGKCLASRPSYGINAAAVSYSDMLPVYIRITDISEDGRFAPNEKVSVKSELSGNYYLSDGDIVFARTGASVGKSYRYNSNDGPLVYAGFLIRVHPNTQKLIPAFAAAYVNTGNYWRWVRLMSMRSGQPGINGNEYSQLPIPLPVLPEQHAIAEALSDVDGLLGGLDRLIAKKRDLKQAAMQQLLTGQTRLPGFHGEWEVKKIGEFTDCTAGGTPSTRVPAYWGDTIRWMSSGELNLKRVEEVEGRITEAGLRNSSTKLIPKRCVLIGLAGQGKTRGTVAMNFVELCTNQSIAAVFPNSAFVPEYLYFNLDSRYDELRELSAGDGGRGGLNLKIIKTIPIPFPSVPEQTAIANVLTDMDAELAALEQRREKTRALKQAMMQELLTGKTRLV